jgi:hypothetical protein
MRTRVAPLVVLSLSLASPALAARTVSPDQPIAVRLELLQPTALSLSEAVGSVSVELAQERLSLDYDGNHLFGRVPAPCG